MINKVFNYNLGMKTFWKLWRNINKLEYHWTSSKACAKQEGKLQQENNTHNIKTAQKKLKILEENNLPSQPLPLSSMPGPGGLKKLPYIGTLFMFQPFTKFSPETFGNMVNLMHDRYGGVFKARLGKDYSVFTENVKDIEAIFRTEDAYPLRRLMTLSKVFRERNGLPHALGTVSGPEWHELRSPLNPLLNRPQVCLHYLPAQNQVADDFVSILQTNALTPGELSEEFFKFAAESIGVVCFNHRLEFLNSNLHDSPERVKLLEAFRVALHCTFIAMIGLERRYLKTSNDPFYLKYEDAMKFIRKISMQYVKKVMTEFSTNPDEHSQTQQTISIKGTNESNLLMSMLRNSNLDIEKILAIIDSMLIAGTDSTARNLTVLFYNLARNPNAQIKAAKEINDLTGSNGPVTPESLARMNYTKACVKESMRINFPLANGTERILSADTIISDYLVPAGTSVIMSSSRSSRNPHHFPEPHKFFPERWLREGTSGQEERAASKNAFAYLPFGHGARGCIGRRFAEMEIYVATAKVLQKLEINVLPSYPGLDPIYTPFITPRSPVPFVFTKRRH